jgi:hypothetical protein
VWNWTGRRSKWTINTENRLTVEAFRERFHCGVVSSVLTNDVFETDPFGGIFSSSGALFHGEQSNDFDTTHPQQHEKEATSFISKCTVTREVPCASRHPVTSLDEREHAGSSHVSHGDKERGGSLMKTVNAYPMLSEPSRGWLKYLHRKVNTPDDWDRGGYPSQMWDDKSSPPPFVSPASIFSTPAMRWP